MSRMEKSYDKPNTFDCFSERHFNGHGLPRGGPYGLEEEFYAAGYYNGGGYPPHPPGYHPAVYHEMNGFHHPGARFHPHHVRRLCFGRGW